MLLLWAVLHCWAAAGQPSLRLLVEKAGTHEEAVAEGMRLPVEALSEAEREKMKEAKATLVARLEDPLPSLGFVAQAVSTLNPARMFQSTWKLPGDTNPFRIQWHAKRQQVIAQGSYPVDGNQVAELIQHVSEAIKRHVGDEVPLEHIHIHINSGSHGDQMGQHADPKDHASLVFAEPKFLQEDLVTAQLRTSARVTVLDLARHRRAAPQSALLVIDAYCYSGRGLNAADALGDTRLLWNVDLIKFRNKLPHPDSPVWDSDVSKKSHLSTASAWAWWNTADKAWILSDVHTGAMSFVGESGFEVTRGPLKGRLNPGDVVYFGDVFAYSWQAVPEEEGAVTIVKEPHFMSGAQLGWNRGVHSVVEAVFGKGAFDRAAAAAVKAEDGIDSLQERIVSAFGADEL
mmetsp:Transcript_45537/g.142811  ORF Transcript_45537/g.142811 Transcript_45537/m.142811 type:complete len:402 (+) Transcript_45537:74-1279(+)